MGQNKYTRYALGFCLVLIMLFYLRYSGYASELAEDQEPLIFLVNANSVPIAYVENGIVKGVVVDIANALGEKIKHRIEVMAMDWPEAQAKVLEGQADALLQINRNSARETVFSFSGPLLQSDFVIFRHQDDIGIQRMADLEGKRVGVESGGYAYDLLSQNERIEKILISSAAKGLESLKAGELDALVVDRWIGEYELAQSQISGIQIAKEPLEINHSHIAVKKGNDQLLELVNYGLKEIENDGTLAEF